MNVVDRAKAIIMKPKETWIVVKGEQTTVKELFFSYVAVLAAIPAIASFIGMCFVGVSTIGFTYRVNIVSGIIYAVLQYILTFVGVYVLAFIIDYLAPNFDSKKDLLAATKVAVFAFTPSWIAGILGIIPALSVLIVIASLYGLYLFFVGLPILMETPSEKTIGYFVVVIVATIIVWILIGFLSRLVIPGPMITP